MRAAVVAEVRKLRSTRLWWVLLIGMAGYLAFVGGVLAFSIVFTPEDQGGLELSGVAAAQSVYGLINAIGYVFPLVVGSLLVTSEFRHRTITASLLVEPRRSVFLGAKLLVALPLGLLYGLAGTVGIVAASAPLLAGAGDGAFLTDRAVVEVLLLGIVVTALWTVIGVAFGSVVPNQVAAIVVLLALTQFVEPIARVALGGFAATGSVAKFLPGSAADGLIGASFLSEMSGGSADLLPRWAALLVLVGYAGVLALVGRTTTLRRDIG
ncbi:ABC transporter permease [Nocardioides hankookensis]|uniref:ABC transporter permease n=1 Tax=Nocardioides hankookensis TaxID=443157 RepID=A0ABW1LL29_9ACTN